MDPTGRFGDEYERAAITRLTIAAHLLTAWHPKPDTHASARTELCRSALAWADTLIAEAAHRFES